MNNTQTRIALLVAALTIPTGIALSSIASAQNAHGPSAVAPVRAAETKSDAETNDGPDTPADAPESGDIPDAPMSAATK